MPEPVRRRRASRRPKTLKDRIRDWYSRNRYRANMALVAVIASVIGLGLAFAVVGHSGGGASDPGSVSAQ